MQIPWPESYIIPCFTCFAFVANPPAPLCHVFSFKKFKDRAFMIGTRSDSLLSFFAWHVFVNLTEDPLRILWIYGHTITRSSALQTAQKCGLRCRQNNLRGPWGDLINSETNSPWMRARSEDWAKLDVCRAWVIAVAFATLGVDRGLQ